MSSSEILTPDSITDEANCVIENLLPEISKERYINTYNDFMKWREDKNIKSFSESVFLTYFNRLCSKLQPSTVWSRYSMLKSTLNVKHNVDLKNFHNLTAFLKRQSQGFKSKKSKVFTSHEVEIFLNDAPDEIYLAVKVSLPKYLWIYSKYERIYYTNTKILICFSQVVLILGISGACRSSELTNLTIHDIESQGNLILVKLTKTKTHIERSFIVKEEFTQIVKKYQKMRPSDVKIDRFFLNYQKGKCYKQVIGKNKISGMPKQIATYLNLPNCEHYTGHCFRRTSATLLADSGANMTMLKRHGGWKSSTVAEGYIEDSVQNKTKISTKLTETIKIRPNSPQPTTSRECPRWNPSSDEIPESPTFTEIQNSQISQNISNNINIPNKNVTFNFTNCPNLTINFK